MESKDRMWTQVLDTDIQCSRQQFLDAIQVWINKPHTVNRRLVGSRQLALTEVKIPLNNERASQLQQHLHLQPDAVETEFIRELVPKQLGRFHTAVEKVLKYTQAEETGCVFIPLVHTDEHGARVHADQTLAYHFSYNQARNKLTLCVSAENEEPPCSSLGTSQEWLLHALVPKLLSWSRQPTLSVETSSLKLMPVHVYTLKYQYLKNKYGPDLVKNWPEKTDPRKFVYEDIAIAAYLAVLWEEEQRAHALNRKQTFVDLGCGNGLLVHILAKEGYKGLGLDIRKRNIWDIYGPETDLQERSITPSDENLFPEYDWLIGNHSDELTPWIPVIAARSSPSCRFFVLPCCAWDFTCKFNLKKVGLSVYQNYLSFVQTVVKTCGFVPERDALRIPSTKKICFVGRKRFGVAAENNIRINNLIDSRKLFQKTNNADTPSSSKLVKDPVKDAINVRKMDHDRHESDKEHCEPVVIDGCHRPGPADSLSSSMRVDTIERVSCVGEPMAISPLRNRDSLTKAASHASDCSDFFVIDRRKRLKLGNETECILTDLSQESKYLFMTDQGTLGAQETVTDEKVSYSWEPSFQARALGAETVSHCTTVSVALREHMVSAVYRALLEDTSVDHRLVTLEGGKTWDRGGSLPLKQVVKLFDADMLRQLKAECGGLQTLLRNHHHIFIVQGGCVRLRDWTRGAEFDALQRGKKKRRGLSEEQIEAAAASKCKTQLCYNHLHHPHGCPLHAHTCRFAHGTHELRTQSNKTV